MRKTGLFDSEGVEITEGDFVSLDGNITADNSMGSLPNGWTFDVEDVYQVFWDEELKNWSLRLDVKPDSDYNKKYYNHALSLLHHEKVKIVQQPQTV